MYRDFNKKPSSLFMKITMKAPKVKVRRHLPPPPQIHKKKKGSGSYKRKGRDNKRW